MFKLEIMDAYGNADTQTIRITVEPAEGTTTGEPDPTGGDTTGEPDPTTSGTSGGDSEGDESGNVDPSVGTSVTAGSASTGPMGDSGEEDGCNCRAESRPGATWLLLLAGLLPLRRRRRG